MSLIEFVVLALSTFRVTSMVTSEAGPYDLFVHVRKRVTFADCFYCVSVWVATVCLLLWYIGWGLTLYPFAFSAAAILLNNVLRD